MPPTRPDDERPSDDADETGGRTSEPQPTDSGVDQRTDAEREAAEFGGE